MGSKRKLSPAEAAQADAMKQRLEQLAAQRRQREEVQTGGEMPPSGFAHGVDPRQIRSGRRGNR